MCSSDLNQQVIAAEAINAIGCVVEAAELIIAVRRATKPEPIKQLAMTPDRAIDKAELLDPIGSGVEVILYCEAIAAAQTQLQIIALTEHSCDICGSQIAELHLIDDSCSGVAIADAVMAVAASKAVQIGAEAALQGVVTGPKIGRAHV